MSREPETMVWVDETDLPSEARALFDADIPLPAGTTLFTESPDPSWFLLSLPGMVFFGGASLAFLTVVPATFREEGVAAGIMSVLFTCLLVFGTYTTLTSVRGGVATQRAHREGRHRFGLFLTPDRAIYRCCPWRTSAACFQLPRARIADVRLHPPEGCPEFVVRPERGTVDEGDDKPMFTLHATLEALEQGRTRYQPSRPFKLWAKARYDAQPSDIVRVAKAWAQV